METDRPLSHSVELAGEPDSLSDIWGQISEEILSNSFTREDAFSVHLALEEAFINAIKHGNEMDPSKSVKVGYSVDSERIEVSVTDQGTGFDPDTVPDPRTGRNLYKPQGRGLLLMYSYMDVVEFNQQGNGVHMVRYKVKPPLAQPASKPAQSKPVVEEGD